MHYNDTLYRLPQPCRAVLGSFTVAIATGRALAVGSVFPHELTPTPTDLEMNGHSKVAGKKFVRTFHLLATA